MFAGNPTKRVHSPRPSRKPLPRPGRSQYLKQRRDVPAAPETLSTASLRTDDGSPYALIGACVARQPGCCGSSRRVAEKRHELPAPHSINSSAMEQERLRDRQPERLGGRCLPGGLCCNSTFPPSLPCVGGQHLPNFGRTSIAIDCKNLTLAARRALFVDGMRRLPPIMGVLRQNLRHGGR